MHTYRSASSSGAHFSGCFARLHYMSAGSPKLLQEIKVFEETLAYRLDALKPKEGGKVLQLSWLTLALTLAYDTHVEAVNLIPPLDFSLLFCDEKWMNDYMDQTTRILDLCNAFTGVFSNVEQSHLLVRHACHILLDVEKAPFQGEADADVAVVNQDQQGEADADVAVVHQDQLARAHKSLREWLDLQASHEPRKFTATLEDMIKGLVPPHEKDLHHGKGFLYALYGANVTIVFALYVLSMAVLYENEIADMTLSIPSTFVWSRSISHLVELVKEDAKQHTGQSLCVEDLGALEVRIKDLFGLIEHALELKEQGLPEEDAKKLVRAVNEMSLLLDDVAKGLDLLGTKLNDVFKAIVSSRSSLLDKLGDFVSDDV